MYELQRPPHLAYAGLGEVRSPRVHLLHQYWQSKCHDGVPPPRAAIEPSEIRRLLPFLVLAEVCGEPFRIFYRLVGTAVATMHREDFTGRDHDSVESLADSGLDAAYRQAMASKSPAFGRTGLYAGDKSWIGFEYAVLPLSDDGATVNKCLAIACPGALEAGQPMIGSFDDSRAQIRQ